MEYTPRVDGFQIRDPSYLPGWEPKTVNPVYDIVKWQTHDKPFRAVNMRTGKEEEYTESCYVVAQLEWDAHEPWFDFRSIGTRWLECNPTRKAIKMIRDFIEHKSKELDENNDEIMKQQSWEAYADYEVCPFCRSEHVGQTKFCPRCGRRVYSRW